MKNLLSFEKFLLIKEAETTDSDENKVSTPKRNSAVLLDVFLKEIKSHVTYWFTYGRISKTHIADSKDITLEKRGLCIWATENEKDTNDEKYQWRIKYTEADMEGMIEKIEKVRLTIDVFDFNREYLIRSTQLIIPLKKVNEDFLLSKINKIKSIIIKTPKSQKDVDKFKDNEDNLLNDNIY